PSYASRTLAHRGENLQRRLAVVLHGAASRGWIEAIRAHAPVFRDQRFVDALCDAERLGSDLPGARIVDRAHSLADLARRADPESVCFADRPTEAEWQASFLGYSS